MEDKLRFRQVHLDFHTSERIDDVGKNFDKEQFKTALKTGHINSITLFSKCHHGWSYHPSKANEMHPHLDFDLLKCQIEAAHEIGVKTPVYISAGYDEKVLREHPQWRNESKDHYFDNYEAPCFHLLCFNTPYLDYLLNQIKEVLENYDADGIFLDIVGVRRCCCASCTKTMFERGMNPNDDRDILALGEEVYANYLKRVRETVDNIRPGLPVFHNSGHIRQGRRDLAYANSHLEIESLPTGEWGYDHFPFSAKYVQNLGLEYLGMTGKFHKSWGEFGGYKHPNALRYEASLSAAFGAKCSIGDQLAPNGKMDFTTYKLIGAAYSELEAKEPWLGDVTPISDIGVLSLESVLNDANEFSDSANLKTADIGVGRILLEGKYQFSVLDTKSDFDKYKVIILPDEIVLNAETYKKLVQFVENGGKILASGNSGISDGKFLFDFGGKYISKGEYKPSYIRPNEGNENETDYIMYEPYNVVECGTGKELAKVIQPYFNRTSQHFCSHQHAPSSGIQGGSGVIQGKDGIYIAWNIFTDYAENGELISKTTVINALDKLLDGQKSLATNLGSMGVSSLMRQKNRYIAHLLYAVPTKRGNDTEIIEDIYPVNGVTLSIRTDEPVKRVYLAPQNKDIAFAFDGNCVSVNDISVNCHQMIIFELEDF